MKKQMETFLKENDLFDEDIYVKIETINNSYEIDYMCEEDSENPFPTVSVAFEISTSDAPLEIGRMEFRQVNSKRFSNADIRMLADNLDFSFYQSVASVKIYRRELLLDLDEYEESEQEFVMQEYSAMSAVLAERGLAGYTPNYELYTFEKNRFSPNTLKIAGSILVLEEITFLKEYNKLFIAEHFIKMFIKQLRVLGWIDWIIVNPNINEEYLKEKNYPASSSQERYTKFWESFKFVRSNGKLHNNEYCLVLEI